MKTMNRIAFGVNAVVAGQKSSTLNALPQLVANSTFGKFMITSPVSKALGIAVGENVMFLNNIQGVEAAIQQRVEDIVAYADEHGLDLDTREGQDACLVAFTQWFIAKGVLQYTAKGEPVMASVRYTKEDKQKYLDTHRAEMVAANRDALIATFGEAIEAEFGELTDEEMDEKLAEKLTVDMVQSPEYHAASGSKTATTSSATGIGCQLTFTDSAIWGALKADLGNLATKKNRVFNVILDDAQKIEYSNGMENVDIMIYPIEFAEDTDPVVRTKKEAGDDSQAE